MLDVAGLFEKHQSKGVLVDTNLLVLYLVGKVNKNRILNFKRTQKYTVEDFELLERAIVWFGSLVMYRRRPESGQRPGCPAWK